ncbi:Alpha/beta knot methyltransferase [Emericellopsis atlantica]|uniref:rRNA methyltransferase 1, mitochondrial n=1 Tax=Emericellopsis atlantica TaxID=2614577 RepID=A0A9P8CLN1_9HYPO|nr:Alpha/beta knot methyltransferase [Emericellopsis atlantica]KAG9251232.1 Alpha/beta knot methyltransferase [Emericellopsis atlantica]
MIRALKLQTPGLNRPILQSHSPSLSKIFTRDASLSAIHRGLRQSERAEYGEARERAPAHARARSEIQSLTQKALDGAGSKRQQAKLLSKLKKKQDEVDGTGKKTRRKRFHDETTDFGKNSLVYQLKHGHLQGLKDTIDPPVKPRGTRMTNDDFKQRMDNTSDEVSATGRSFQRRDGRPARNVDTSDDRDTRPTRHEPEDGVFRPAPRERRHNMMPLQVKYTTAASQFLYGTSVVKSALDQGQRKLYNLYIYGGENRRQTWETVRIKNLARQKNVPITIVPAEDQRLMDKMSQGRPHNGFVLETSPLPTRKVASLGALEERPDKLGFHVELGYQSKEEDKVNGSDTFVPRRSAVTARPLVLFLNEVVDPGNLGAIIRTASYLGVDAVGISSSGSSDLTPVVQKSGAGAIEEMTIFKVDNAESFLRDSSNAGWKTYAAVPPIDNRLARQNRERIITTDDVERSSPVSQHPCVIVLGNEGIGLPKPVKAACTHWVSIPKFMQETCVDSLNVSVAAGLLVHSFVKKPLSSDVAREEAAEHECEDEAGDEVAEPQGEKMF